MAKMERQPASASSKPTKLGASTGMIMNTIMVKLMTRAISRPS